MLRALYGIFDYRIVFAFFFFDTTLPFCLPGIIPIFESASLPLVKQVYPTSRR